MAKAFVPCHIPKLSAKRQLIAMERARELNPPRWPDEITPALLTVNTRKWWGDKGRKFKVAFASGTPANLRKRILEHANAWSEYANVEFVESSTDSDIRISFGRSGHWSYVGIDALGIPKNQATMNLDSFTYQTSESEYRRVVRHEVGHALGFEHEHMRQELVSRLDEAKTISYFRKTQGWSATVTRQQVLTPLNQRSIRGTPEADDTSIMCYQLPGSITKDGRPIRGGSDINSVDGSFVATIYPRAVVPPDGEIAAEFEIGGVRYRITKIA